MSPSTALDPSFYKLSGGGARPDVARGSTPPRTHVRVEVRALEGMQKEAIVTQVEPAGSRWRMVSDEGPYLNGTDLAPFPLAFFTAGQQFCLMAQVVRIAGERGVPLEALRVAHDNKYTMTGSILRGDMTGGALPAESRVSIESSATPGAVARLVTDAAAASGGQAIMRDVLANRFSLVANGTAVELEGLGRSTAGSTDDDPAHAFAATADGHETPDRPIMEKVETVEVRHGVTGGAGSSLKAEQDRTLHVRGDARLVEGTRMETTIRLFKPLGSSFRLACDVAASDGGTDTAPPPLAYVAAGVGFCFMTQLGRYAHIKKQVFEGVRMRQESVFRVDDGIATVEPLDTHVVLDTREAEREASQLVRMGEQTCFLHAAMRGAHPGVIDAELNGRPLPLA